MPQATGTHIILNGNDANIDFSSIEIEKIEKYLHDTITHAGINILGKIFHDFKDPTGAFTGIFLLGESHFSIHTFPETKYITVDIYTCNMTRDYTDDSMQIMHHIIKYFQIQNPIIHTLQR